MLKKLSYNQMRFVSLVSETAYVLLSIAAIYIFEENEPILLFIIKSISLFVAIITISFVLFEQYSTPNYADEMSNEHDNRASQRTLALLLAIVSALSLVTQLLKFEISISSDLLLCLVFAIYAIRDAYYLYLEKEGAKDARIDNED